MFQQIYGKEHCTINIHLHGHLKECVMDFGPVYSFWLFSFERLNGLLGSYHTNGRDVSLQIMRRFLSTHNFSMSNWPEEYVSEFSHLLSSCTYNKGSLNNSDSTQSECTNLIEALPPVSECAWLPHEKESLHHISQELVSGGNYSIHTLYQKCKAMKFRTKGYILGSQKSCYSTSSHVLAKHPRHPDSRPHLARIEFLAKVDIQLLSSDPYRPTQVQSHWFAAVSYYFEHQCRVWFGYPCEVWPTALFPNVCYVPLSYITCRVAFCQLDVDFGHVIGKERFTVVSPLSDA